MPSNKRLVLGHGEQPEWPQLCPFQNRKICCACWYGTHKGACDGPCQCLHLSEKAFADDERAKIRHNLEQKRKMEREALEESPLRAENPASKPTLRGRAHA